MWNLPNDIIYLNHGSFGACPKKILACQQRYIELLETQPVRFFTERYEPLMMRTQETLAGLMNAESSDIVPVRNATEGVNTVLRALKFNPGDEILITDHGYNACRNAVMAVAERTGCSVVVASLPFPIQNAEELKTGILSRLTTRTRLVLIDHITSPTAVILPVKEIVDELNLMGIDSLIDGAHAPGQIPVDLKSINPTFYTGNCHKWLCTPKGSAFLYVRKDKQNDIRPLIISHGANSPRTDKSRFLLEFGWQGTADISAYFSVPEAMDLLSQLHPQGLSGLMNSNHDKVITGRNILLTTLNLISPVPDNLHGSMATIILPDHFFSTGDDVNDQMRLNKWLWEEEKIECMCLYFKPIKKCLLRISAQAYNKIEDYERLADALKKY